MPRSPTPSHRTIVNAANVLPSVETMLAQAPGQAHRRNSSRPLSPSPYPPGPQSTRGSSMDVDNESNMMNYLNFPSSPPASPQSGYGSPTPYSPGPYRSSSDGLDQPVMRWVNTTTDAYPHPTQTPPPVELPVIPNRMGGRYAQTPHHPNGQPHAPGFMPRRPGEPEPPKVKKVRRVSQPNPALGIVGPVSPPPNEMRKVVASQEFQRAMDAAGRPSCGPCSYDIKLASLRKAVAQLGPAYAQYAHGLRPQLPTILPDMEGLIKIPFVPKPLGGMPGGSSSQAGVVHVGVSLSEIMDFADVLEDPDDPAIKPLRLMDGSMSKIYLIMEHPGYPQVMKELEGNNCLHRPVTRFSLAYSVAEAYSSYFTNNSFTLRGPAPPNTIVVRSFVNLRLVNLYSTDAITYRAHVAYVF